MINFEVQRRADNYVWRAPFSSRELCRTIPGARYDKTQDEWRAPATMAQFAAFRVLGVEAAEPLSPTLYSDLSLADSRARAYQTIDKRWATRREGVLIGYEVGLGKTLVSLLATGAGPGPHLVVCPNSLKYNWRNEIRKWTSHLEPLVIDGTAKQRRDQLAEITVNSVVIINYEALRLHSRLVGYGPKKLTEAEKTNKELNRPWGTVIADEVHRISDPGAKQTRALKAAAGDSMRRIGLSGTPLSNRYGGLYSIFHFLRPDMTGDSKQRWEDLWLNWSHAWRNKGRVYHGIKNREEFDMWVNEIYVFRSKKEHLPELGDVMEPQVIELPMTKKQAASYNRMAKEMVATSPDTESWGVSDGVLAQLGALRQMANAMPELDEDGNLTGATSESNKLEWLKEFMDSEPGPVVAFCQSRRWIEMAVEKIPGACKITGAESPLERQRLVDAFQAGTIDLLLITYGAGSEGLTLTRSSIIVLVDLPWSFREYEQAIGRLHRMGQENIVTPIILQSVDTVDLHVYATVQSKGESLADFTRSGTVPVKSIVYGEHIPSMEET